jgi:nitroreductase
MTDKKTVNSTMPVGGDYVAMDLPDRWELSDDVMEQRSKDFVKLMQKRHTVRDYTDKTIPQNIIENCIRAAALAPSGANHQPWHFALVRNPEAKHRIRLAAEEEEKIFYEGRGGDEWLNALEPIGTNDQKPFLDIAPWLIVIFRQTYGYDANGTKYKNYYVGESVGIATGVLITALHNAGLSTLTHTPNPMKFLNELCGRPAHEKPEMILVVGHPDEKAQVPKHAKWKKPFDEITTII